MKIKITIADTNFTQFSEKQYDAYVSELRARVKEIYPESELLITHDDETHLVVEGFHDNDQALIVVHELEQEVFLHGYWRK